MYRFPVTEDLAFLVGDEVISVTLASYAVDIKFAGGSLIRVELGLEYVDIKGKQQIYDPQRRFECGPIFFHAIVGDRVTRLDSDDFRLTFVFSSGQTLVILSDDSRHEAGQIMPATYVDGVLKGSPMIVF
jgi:hypothetical protein